MGDDADRGRYRKHPRNSEPTGGCPHNKRTWAIVVHEELKTTVSTCDGCKKVLGERTELISDVTDVRLDGLDGDVAPQIQVAEIFVPAVQRVVGRNIPPSLAGLKRPQADDDDDDEGKFTDMPKREKRRANKRKDRHHARSE